MPLTVRVWDFMDRDFKTIGPGATLGEAMEAMMKTAESNPSCRSLIVVNEKGRPMGAISMRNILDAMGAEFPKWHRVLGKREWDEALEKGLEEADRRLVKDYMVEVPQLRINDNILHAYHLLIEKKINARVLPVVEVGKIEGVVRVPELFEALVETYRKRQAYC